MGNCEKMAIQLELDVKFWKRTDSWGFTSDLGFDFHRDLDGAGSRDFGSECGSVAT